MQPVGGNGSVLVVEDHEDTACLLRFILEREGYGVTHLRDGQLAQQFISTTPHVLKNPVPSGASRFPV